MNSGIDADSESLHSFEQVLAAYLEATEDGQTASRETWLANHVGVAERLHHYFDAVDAVDVVTRRIRHAPRPAPREILGSYQLLAEIGRGGMGIVYRARHLQLDRIVALKLVRGGQFLASSDLQRFQNEAEAASQLDDPNIVPIYDFGEHDGQFYFTMKLVEGTSLANWNPGGAAASTNDMLSKLSETLQASEHHDELLMPDSSGHSLQRRIQAEDAKFRQVRIAKVLLETARAVHHAHQRGILHRDLKPSNILLDHDEHAFVADFGLAKQVHRNQEITQTGAILGTPSYMAPEQTLPVLGDAITAKERRRSTITTAVDIYGLGAILYFLLTGRPPFKGATPLATLALVRDTEVSPPRLLNPAIDRDLDAICQKCLEKEPGRRYESAEALAQDLKRWLSGEPTLARPPRRSERMWRWCRRNRLLTGMLATIAVLAGFCAGSLAVGIVAANRARNDAISQRQTALANLRAVIAEINDLENRRPDLDEMRLELLTRVQKQLEPMLKDSAHGSLADETNFWLEIDAGDVQKLRGQALAARSHFERALKTAGRIPAKPAGTQQRLFSFAVSRIGDADAMSYRHADACRHYEKSLDIRRTLAAADPGVEAQADLAIAHLKLATGLIRVGEQPPRRPELFVLAKTQAEQALSIYEALVTEQPTVVWHARFLGYAREPIADVHFHQRQWKECIVQCRLGLDSLQAAKMRMPEYGLILDVHSGFLLDLLSVCCVDCGMFEAGENAASESLQIRQRLVQPSPQAIFLRRGLMWSLERLGRNQHGLGRTAEAMDSFDQAAGIGEELTANSPELKDIRREMFLSMDQSIDASLPHPEFDDRTLRNSDRRLLLKRAEYESNPEDGSRSRVLFVILLEFSEFYMLRGDREMALQTLQSIERLLDSAQEMDERSSAQTALAEHLQLCQHSGKDGFDIANALVEVSRSQCVLIRLQSIFKSRGDHVRLALASTRLDEGSDAFRQTYAAAQGLAQAAHMATEHEPRDAYSKRLDGLLNQLRTFGDHAVERINADPVFTSAVAPEKAEQ